MGANSEAEIYSDKLWQKNASTTITHEEIISGGPLPYSKILKKVGSITTQLSQTLTGARDTVYNFTRNDNENAESFTFAKDKAEIKVTTETNTYLLKFNKDAITISLEDGADSGSVAITTAGITIDAGTNPLNKIILGGSGSEQQLVTKSWVSNLFDTHVHPTAVAGPPSAPLLPTGSFLAIPDAASSPYTKQTEAE